jgi:hypothetical protein
MNYDDPRIARLLTAWHESGRAQFEASYKNLVYDTYSEKTAKDRQRYIALDYGQPPYQSGRYLVDKETELIYHIKAYGVPNRKKCLGTVDEVIALWEGQSPR